MPALLAVLESDSSGTKGFLNVFCFQKQGISVPFKALNGFFSPHKIVTDKLIFKKKCH